MVDFYLRVGTKIFLSGQRAIVVILWITYKFYMEIKTIWFQAVEMKCWLFVSSLELFVILYFPFYKSLFLQFFILSLCLAALSLRKPFVLCCHLLAPRGTYTSPIGQTPFTVCLLSNENEAGVSVCVCVRCPPGDAGEVAEDILDLLLLQLAESWELREDDDGAAVHPAAPWWDTEVRGTHADRSVWHPACWIAILSKFKIHIRKENHRKSVFPK